jgi:hypothetical protein
MCNILTYSHITKGYVKDALIEKDRLLQVRESLLGFFADRVINLKGQFYYHGHPIDQPSSFTN